MGTIVEQIRKDMAKEFGRSKADLAMLFISATYRDQLIDSWSSLRKEIPAKLVLGCTAGGVIGDGQEIEEEAAVSLISCKSPGVEISPFHVHQPNLPTRDGSPRLWHELMKIHPDENPHFIILSDPFSFDAEHFIEGLDFGYPKAAKIGGLASGGTQPNENLLLFNERAYHQGAIGVVMSGDIAVDTVVAQGCRPIGEALTITEADGQILLSVNNQRPIKYLSALFEKLNERDRELLKTSLFFGISMDPLNAAPKQGDFLIRNIMGLNMEEGIIAIGATLRPGQTVQFHLRDSETSHDDLNLMLANSKPDRFKDLSAQKNAGALLFSCLGRGHRLYGKPHHDSHLFRSVLGEMPVAGFFCNGEIGPVRGRTYLHGYTSSFGVFSPAAKTAKAEQKTSSKSIKKDDH